MMKWLPSLLSRNTSAKRSKFVRRCRLLLETLEDRLVPAGNLMVTVAGPYPQHLFREYTPTGAIVRAVNIPATPGSNFDYARDIVEDPSGKVYVYNGTFTAYLAAYNPATSSWTQTPYPGWSTVSNVSYGGLAEFGNFIYATDMATAGAMPNGVVRFNLADGSATRFGNVDFIDLNVGLDGKLYALTSSSTIYEYDPIGMGLIRTITLPYADYRGIAVNANGDIFTAAWNNVISHFNSNGVLQSSITLNSSNGAPFMFNWTDGIDVAPDGTLAIGSFSGYIAEMSSSFTNISYINTGANNQVFVSFAPQQGPPQPTISVSDVSVVGGNGGMGGPMAQFMLTLSAPSSQTVTVHFATADGTANGGSLSPGCPFDYNSMSGTIGFAPGATTQVVMVPIYGDGLYEPNENFYLNLSQPVNATLAKAQGTCTIVNNAPAPTISVGNVTVTAPTSGYTWASFPITLSNAAGVPIYINYNTANGTATAGADFQGATNGTLTIPAGVTTTYLSLEVYGDPYWDPQETFTLKLSNPSAGTLAQPQGTATINSSLPLPTASVSNITVTNASSGTTPATFTVSLSEPLSDPASVAYTTADVTAHAGSDYQAVSATLNFSPGQTSQTVTVNVIGDPLYDGPEIFDLNLVPIVSAGGGGGGSGGGGSPYATGVATIVSGVPMPSASVNDVTVQNTASGTTATFTVTLSAASNEPATVGYSTLSGTASPGSDYQSTSNTLTFAPGQTSQTVTVNIIGDPYYDGTETFYLNLLSPTGATLGRAQGTGTILSTLPLPTLSISNPTVQNGTSGLTPVTFTVSLSEPMSDPASLGYTTADVTAHAGSDYQAVSGILNFSAGQTSQTVTVNLIGDPLYDAPEIFDLNLVPIAGGSPFATGVATIISGVPMPSASVNDVTVQNTASGTTATFTVSLSAPSNETATVGYSTISGTASVGSDYQSTSSTLTFAPGQTSQTVTVNITGDPYYDGTETFYLNLLSPPGATLGRAQGTGTILSTLPPPTVSVSNPTVQSGTFGLTPVTFTISLSGPLSDPTTVPYTTADGSASAGNDYQVLSGYVSFSPGQTSQTVTVNVIGDPNYDSPETFNLNLLPLAGGALYASGTATIVSSLAQPTLSISNDTVTNGTSGTTPMVFAVTLSGPSGDPVTVQYATTDGSAVAGTDYQGASGTLTFAPGQTSQTITVNAIGNPLYAPTRTFFVNLSGAIGATVAQVQGIGTIVNSSAPPYVNIGGVNVTDVDTGTTTANFYVWLSSGSSVPVTVNYATVDGTAVAGTDYVASSGTLTFAPGQTSQYISVPVIGSAVYAPGRTFSVVLSNPQNARMGSQGGNCTIFDDAPIANIGPSTTVNEGSAVQFDASGSQSLDGDPLTFTWNFGDGSSGSGAQPTHAYTDEGVYTATVYVSDGSAVSTATETVTVLSVPPTVAFSGPTDSVPGQTRTFTFSATDIAPIDQAAGFTYQVTWGDGSTQTIQGGASVSVTHAFAAAGPYSVYATATDQDGNTGSVRQLVQVVTAELQGGDLYVGGTTGDDVITIQPADTNGTVDVVVNGQDQGPFVPTGQVVVYGQTGNDVIQVVALNANGSTTPLALPVMMFAGNGNDTLDARGASGPTVLVGGGGNDILYGGSGRNILIAGAGASSLNGGAGDLLIAGSTAYDANLAALLAIRNEWARTDADYLTRIADLSGSQSGGLNGSYLLSAQTVTSSGAGDDLYGGPGLDWFFAAASDRIHNLGAGEVVTNL